ncbi:MAG: hypothetical protein V4555_04340, partial [Acidobacteriota bacterium]
NRAGFAVGRSEFTRRPMKEQFLSVRLSSTLLGSAQFADIGSVSSKRWQLNLSVEDSTLGRPLQ